MSDVLTAAEVRRLGIEPATLRQWVRRGHVHRHGRNAYDAEDVWRMLCKRAGLS